MKDLPAVTFSEVTVQAGPVDMLVCFPHYVLRGREQQFSEQLVADRAALEKLVGQSAPDFAPAAKSVSTLRKYLGLQKVRAVVDLVADELDSGLDKIILFAHHKDVIEGLRTGLSRFKPVTVYGGTPAAKRDYNVERFQTELKCRVFIGHPIATVGVNLTAACSVMMVEPDWVPGNNQQAIDRAIRIGQTRPVLVRFVMLENDELDRRIQQVLARKTRDLVQVFD